MQKTESHLLNIERKHNHVFIQCERFVIILKIFIRLVGSIITSNTKFEYIFDLIHFPDETTRNK